MHTSSSVPVPSWVSMPKPHKRWSLCPCLSPLLSRQASPPSDVFPRRHSERCPHQDRLHSPSNDGSFTAVLQGCLGTAVKGVSQEEGQTSVCRTEGMIFQCSVLDAHTGAWLGWLVCPCAQPPTLWGKFTHLLKPSLHAL